MAEKTSAKGNGSPHLPTKSRTSRSLDARSKLSQRERRVSHVYSEVTDDKDVVISGAQLINDTATPVAGTKYHYSVASPPGTVSNTLFTGASFVDVSYIYLLRDSCLWCPANFISCCFKKARLTNAVLSVGDDEDEDDDDEAEGDVDGSDDDLEATVNDQSGLLAHVHDHATSPNNRKSKKKSKKVNDELRVFKLIFLIAITAFAGVFNNVMFVKMGLAMPGYPSFLLYFTTLLYVVIYVLWLWYRRRSEAQQVEIDNNAKLDEWANAASINVSTGPNGYGAVDNDLVAPVLQKYPSLAATLPSPLVKLYLFIGALITIGGACSQYADPHVSGSMQAVINQLTLPLTSFFAYKLLGHKFSKLEIIGALVVFLASCMPIVPMFVSSASLFEISQVGTTVNNPFWVLVFLLSDIPSALVNVIEEIAFCSYKADEIHYLAFTNLITLFGYAALIPMDKLNPGQDPALVSLSITDIQREAFRCFFGMNSGLPNMSTVLPPACAPQAWLPVVGFVLCIVVYFYVTAVVVKHESAAFQALANTLVTPLSAVAFSSVFIMGQQAQPLDAYTVLAILIIPAGIVIYKWEELMGDRKDDIIPLIARH